MFSRNKLVALSCLALTVGAGQAGADPLGEPGYATRYYSDSTHQTQVGTEYPICTYQGVRYGRQGTVTAYSETELVFYCNEGVAEPA